jgi:hypothetical protein
VVLDRARRHARRRRTDLLRVIHPLRPTARGVRMATGFPHPPSSGARIGAERHASGVMLVSWYRGYGISTRQRGPLARARRLSSVSSVAFKASASATYSASGALSESRSCHARSSSGRWSTRVAGQDSKSSIAWWAAVRSSSPRRCARRTTPRTSASTKCGAAWSGSLSRRVRTGSASKPASTISATHEASTTNIAQLVERF